MICIGIPVGAATGNQVVDAGQGYVATALAGLDLAQRVGGDVGYQVGSGGSAQLVVNHLQCLAFLRQAQHGLGKIATTGGVDPASAKDQVTLAAHDGLLTFQEIFDLKLDADLVILSACDTAGAATVAATREAGVASGGGNALDGLVRSFIGAGGRSVIASHWPAPDDFDATKRLIGGLFAAPQGESIADALWASEKQLMDDKRTSHPYYWAGFAIIGDGGQPLLHGTTATAQKGAAGQSAL